MWLGVCTLLLVSVDRSMCSISRLTSVSPCVCITQFVVPAYRLAQTVSPPADSSSTSSKIEFYILQITMEWLASTALLAVNAKEWCGVQDYVAVKTSEDNLLAGKEQRNWA